MPTDSQVAFYSRFLHHATQSAISAIRESAIECETDIEVPTKIEPRLIAELFVAYDAISNLNKGAEVVDSVVERIYSLLAQDRELPEANAGCFRSGITLAVAGAVSSCAESLMHFYGDLLRERQQDQKKNE